MNSKEKALFCEQLSMVLDAGISFSDGLIAVPNELSGLNQELENGCELSEALKNCGINDDYMVSLIKVGEESGYLSESLKQLSIYYNRLHEVKSKLKEALTYPVVLIVMMMVVIGVLIVKVLPIFEGVLKNIGVSISPLAKTLMNSGKYLATFGLIIIVVVVVFGLYLYCSFASKKTGVISNMSKVPFISKIGRKMALAKFAFEMSLLGNSGYDVDSSLKLCKDSCQNREISKKIEQILSISEEGTSLSESLMDVKLFDGIYDQLLSVGFKSGKSVEAMSKVASEYEKEVDDDINHYLDAVEPIVIGILCLVVGAILLSVMLPLMSIMSSL